MGRPDYAIFDEDFAMPKTLKANLGYERLLPTNTRFALDFIFSESWDMYTIRDLNLRDPVFTLSFEENRPVYVPATGYNPGLFGGSARLRNTAFNRVFFNTSDGEARSFNVNVTLDQRFADWLNASLSYGYNRAYDNSSFSCCTTGEGWGTETTWGDPNFLGDPGDDEQGAWGVSRFERRHVIVGSAIWRAPLGIHVNGIWRSQSGTPWTPVVQGDLNGDDQQFNERAFVSRDHVFATPADAERFEQILEDFDCVAEQLGRVVARNSCRNPWWHTMDLRLSKEFRTFRGQRIELLADLFNVVDGIGQLFCDSDEDENEDGRLDNAGDGTCGWGDYRAVFTDATNLLTPCVSTGTNPTCTLPGYDAVSNKVRYRVIYNRDLGTGFGAERPSGFDPFQFQAQFGIRYRF
jgi:hypothetical protein